VFQNEDDFQAFFIEHFGKAYLGSWLYAKITKIGGELIQPEIDLLDISPFMPGQTITALEFKLLNSRVMKNNYGRIYNGFGQALSYFRYGIDRSYLVIGISDNISSDDSHFLRDVIRQIGDPVSHFIINRFRTIFYDEFLNEVWHVPFTTPIGRFERRTFSREYLEPIELFRDNIIALNFPKRRGNNFFRRHGLEQYVTPVR